MKHLTVIEKTQQAGMVASDSPTLNDLVATWLNGLNLTEASRTTYNQSLRNYFEYCTNEQTNPASRPTFRQWVQAMKQEQPLKDTLGNPTQDTIIYAPSTVNLRITCVRSFFKWLESEGLATDITKGVKLLKTAKGHKRDELTKTEVRAVLDLPAKTAVEKRNRLIIALMAYAGLRGIEVQRLKWGDYATKQGKAIMKVQGKGRLSKDDFVMVSEQLERAIMSWRAVSEYTTANDFIICGTHGKSKGKSITTRSISRIVIALFHNAGIDTTDRRKTMHSLRHSFATNLIESGADIFDVSKELRHSNVQTTMIYAHANQRLTKGIVNSVAY